MLRAALESILASVERRAHLPLAALARLDGPAPLARRVVFVGQVSLEPDEEAALEDLADALSVPPLAAAVAEVVEVNRARVRIADAAREALEQEIAPVLRAAYRGGLDLAILARARATARLAALEHDARRLLLSRDRAERRGALRALAADRGRP